MKYDTSKEADKARAYLEKLIAKQARVEVKEFRDARTLNQNSYFHLCCQILASDTGYTTEEIKQIIKDELEFMKYKKGDRYFLRSTADLNKDEFTVLIEVLLNFALEHGFNLPSPDEYLNNQFTIQKNYERTK